jgi:predicted acetyltransferase
MKRRSRCLIANINNNLKRAKRSPFDNRGRIRTLEVVFNLTIKNSIDLHGIKMRLRKYRMKTDSREEAMGVFRSHKQIYRISLVKELKTTLKFKRHIKTYKCGTARKYRIQNMETM